MNWIANQNTIIFNTEFNEIIDISLISTYTKLIFSEYELNEQLFEHYSDNNFKGLKWIRSKFNQNVSNLHPFSYTFNFWL